MAELKPCPFCGGTDIKMYAYSIAPECSVECQQCGARIDASVPWRRIDTEALHDHKCWKKLAKKWNRRAQNDKE